MILLPRLSPHHCQRIRITACVQGPHRDRPENNYGDKEIISVKIYEI